MTKFYFADEPIRLKNAKAADPDEIGGALTKIAAENNGELQPQHVVEAAKDRRHPLHKHFEWDDKKAADAFRLDQARSIIRIVRTKIEEDEPPVRAFYSVKDDNGQRYRAVETVMSSVSLQLALLKAAERDLRAFQNRYRAIQDIAESISEAVSKIERRIRKTGGEGRAAA